MSVCLSAAFHLPSLTFASCLASLFRQLFPTVTDIFFFFTLCCYRIIQHFPSDILLSLSLYRELFFVSNQALLMAFNEMFVCDITLSPPSQVISNHGRHRNLELDKIRSCWATEILLFSNCFAGADKCLCNENLILNYTASYIGLSGKKKKKGRGNVILFATERTGLLLASLFFSTFPQLPSSWFNPLQQLLLPQFRNDPIHLNILANARQLIKRNRFNSIRQVNSSRSLVSVFRLSIVSFISSVGLFQLPREMHKI